MPTIPRKPINSKIYNSIIRSYSVFGSMYIFSNTLRIIFINQYFLNEPNGIHTCFIYVTCAVSGFICINKGIKLIKCILPVDKSNNISLNVPL